MYRIYDRNDKLIAESQERDEVIRAAIGKHPNQVMVLEHTDEEGRTTASFVGPAPASLGC